MFKSYIRNISGILFLGISSALFSQSQNTTNVATDPSIIPQRNLSNNVLSVTKEDSIQVGTATIQNGKAVIQLFNKMNSDRYGVTITPQCNDCGQLRVSEKGETSFTVMQTGGNGNATFSYDLYLKPNTDNNSVTK